MSLNKCTPESGQPTSRLKLVPVPALHFLCWFSPTCSPATATYETWAQERGAVTFSRCALNWRESKLWQTSEHCKGSGELMEECPFSGSLTFSPGSVLSLLPHTLAASSWHSINLACAGHKTLGEWHWLFYRHTLLHLFRHWPCILKISSTSL